MKTFIFMLGLLTLISVPAFAQNSNHAYHADGYGFFSYNAPQGASFGGGGEAFLFKGLGAGVDFAPAHYYYRWPSSFNEGPGSERSYITSFNAIYSAPTTDKQKFQPFVTAGYSLFFQGSGGLSQPNGINGGGGVNIWFAKHAALRLELRIIHGGRNQSATATDSGLNLATPSLTIYSIRVGMTFR